MVLQSFDSQGSGPTSGHWDITSVAAALHRYQYFITILQATIILFVTMVAESTKRFTVNNSQGRQALPTIGVCLSSPIIQVIEAINRTVEPCEVWAAGRPRSPAASPCLKDVRSRLQAAQKVLNFLNVYS